jgi:nijmegen breakage syndrome protein 1
VPVVFTFSFTSKEKKARPYESLYDLLGPLDIKVLDEYRSQVTTHVVAKKRNTAKGLQALIEGKHIVHNDSFINAVIAASHAAVGGKSPLENDFGLNWPDEQQFLPPKGEEPTARRDEAYAPSQGRQDMFDGYTFVFYERKQFQNLLPPITTGRGKALFRDVIPETTTVDDFVRYVKSVAGEKGLGELEDGSVGRGVVVVRFNPVGGEGSEWYAEFGRKVALQLDQRLIEQNEFLDAILGQDGSVLRKPLDFISSSVAAPLPSTGEFLVLLSTVYFC